MGRKTTVCDWDCFHCKFPDCIRNGSESPDTNKEAQLEKSRLRNQALRSQRKAAGLCIKCGKHPPVPGGVTCEGCRARNRVTDKNRRERQRASGICTKCGKRPVLPDRVYCAECLVMIREESARRKMKKGGGVNEIQAT